MTHATKGPAIKKWIYDKLVEVCPTATVTYGAPKYFPKTWIMVGDLKWSSSDWKTNRSREEEVSVTVVFSLQYDGGSAIDAEAAVIQVAAPFEDAVFNDRGMAPLGVITCGVKPTSLASFSIPSGFEGQYEIEVVAKCRP